MYEQDVTELAYFGYKPFFDVQSQYRVVKGNLFLFCNVNVSLELREHTWNSNT